MTHINQTHLDAEARYRKQVGDAYNWFDLSGIGDDQLLSNVPLEEVFVRLTLTVEKIVREPDGAPGSAGVPPARHGSREQVRKVQEPIALHEALGGNAVIVGEPGAGKSTLLRWLAVTFAQRRQREADRLGPAAEADRLPLRIELGRLPPEYLRSDSHAAPNWRQFLPTYVANKQEFHGTPPEQIAQALADSRCLLLCDGLDEVADFGARTRIAQSLAELGRITDNRVVVGSRPAGASAGMLPSFKRCEIVRFRPEDVQAFFHSCYKCDPDLTDEQQQAEAGRLYAALEAKPRTFDLATRPLLCTILLLIWRKEGILPERRAELYERCCAILIDQWEQHKGVAAVATLPDIGAVRPMRLLALVAYEIHREERRTSIKRAELRRLLAKVLCDEKLCADERSAEDEAERYLDALSRRSGLLQYVSDDSYGFPHLTFQEYLAARTVAALGGLLGTIATILGLWEGVKKLGEGRRGKEK